MPMLTSRCGQFSQLSPHGGTLQRRRFILILRFGGLHPRLIIILVAPLRPSSCSISALADRNAIRVQHLSIILSLLVVIGPQHAPLDGTRQYNVC